MNREQFTFYRSFFNAIQRIRKKADRADAYDAISKYALDGTEPELDKLPDLAAVAFLLCKPNLDSARRKAQGGKKGSSVKDTAKIEGRCEEDTAKIEGRCDEDTANKKKKEKENKIENECSPPVYSPSPTDKPPARHSRSEHGWVKLTDEEYTRLVNDLGQEELARCIAYVDESAQTTGNKNRWKDWNLVIRKCNREGWGLSAGRKPGYAGPNGPQKIGELERRALARMMGKEGGKE